MTNLQVVAELQSWVHPELAQMGPQTSFSYRDDPKRLLFQLARYKFVSKILAGRSNVLEVGCGDGFGAPLVAQTVTELVCVDQDRGLIEGNRKRLESVANLSFEPWDILISPCRGFDASYSLDVIEHIPPEKEVTFMENMVCDLTVIGTPNINAAQYGSPSSQLGHINLHSHDSLKRLMERYFRIVMIYSMNDEVVHTGYSEMAHYFIGVGCSSANQSGSG